MTYDTNYNLVTYYIDSNNRIGGTWHNFIYDMGFIPEHCNACHISKIQIPKSYYLINEYNSNFVVEYDGANYFVSLKYGDYTDDQFFNMIIEEFDFALNGNPSGVCTLTIQKNGPFFPDSEVNLKKPTYYFSDTSRHVTFKFSLLPSTSNINTLLGFEKKDYTSEFIGLGLENRLTAPNIYNLCIGDKLYLICDFVNEDAGGKDSSNVLNALYLYNIPFGACAILDYEFSRNNIKNIKNPNSIKIARFALVGENDQDINLNGIQFWFTIHFFKKL